MNRTESGVVTAAIAACYLAAYLAVRPLANAPVVDSWIYAHSVQFFCAYGEFRFAGFTQAMPIAQVIYGAAWARLFGYTPVSLDLSVACLGAIGGVLFYALARRCGAGRAAAALATAILIANPCYLFLSFSFMTEIPFLVLLIAAFLAFARAERARENRWLRICAALAVAAFLVRPFAAAAIAGFIGALLLYDLRGLDRDWLRRAAPRLAPFAVALVVCAIAWVWLTVLSPLPWGLRGSEHQIEYLFDVRPVTYLRAGIIGPMLYLGIVVSPLAAIQLVEAGLRRAAAIAAGIFALTWVLVRLDPKPPATPELSCFGGWDNALLLHGLPNHFRWEGAGQWIAVALGSVGAAGIVVAAPKVYARLNRASAAVLLTGACYWAGTIPLWLFNDRYYMVLVPISALALALVPQRSRSRAMPAAIAMTAVMGYLSLGGVYDYQRGLATVMEARDEIERTGVPRSAIDAGYSLNGAELYQYPDKSEDTYKLERGIPMITSAALDEYTIAAAPIAGTEIVRTFKWPGPFGLRPSGAIRAAHRSAPLACRPPPGPHASPIDEDTIARPLSIEARSPPTHPPGENQAAGRGLRTSARRFWPRRPFPASGNRPDRRGRAA